MAMRRLVWIVVVFAFAISQHPRLSSGGDKRLRSTISNTPAVQIKPVGRGPIVRSRISPTGRILATLNDGTIRLSDIESRLELRAFRIGAGVTGVQFTDDGNYLLTAQGGKIRKWETKSGRVVHHFDRPEEIKKVIRTNTQDAIAIRKLYNFRRISGDKYVGVNTSGKRAMASLFGSDGKLLQKFNLVGQAHRLSAREFLPDSERVLTGDVGGFVFIHNLRTKVELRRWQAHKSKVVLVACSAGGEKIISMDDAGKLRTWINASNEPDVEIDLSSEIDIYLGSEAVAISPNQKWLLTKKDLGEVIKLWSLEAGKLVRTIEHKGRGNVRFGRSDDICYSFAGDFRRTELVVWNTRTGREVSRTNVNSNATSRVFAYHPDGLRYAAVRNTKSGDRTLEIQIRAMASGRVLKTITLPANVSGNVPVRKLAFSAAGHDLILLHDKCVVWDIEKGEARAQTPPCWSARLSLDDRFLTTNVKPHDLLQPPVSMLWDTKRATVVEEFDPVAFFGPGHGKVTSMAVSADGRKLLSGGLQKTARLWDVMSGKTLKVLKRHNGPVSAVAFSSNGRFAATGTWYNTALVWNLESGKRISSYQVRGSVHSVQLYSHDTKLMVGTETAVYLFQRVPSQSKTGDSKGIRRE